MTPLRFSIRTNMVATAAAAALLAVAIRIGPFCFCFAPLLPFVLVCYLMWKQPREQKELASRKAGLEGPEVHRGPPSPPC